MEETNRLLQSALSRIFENGKIAPHVARRGYALSTEDDMGKVLRIHLLIERALQIGIAQVVPHPEKLPKLRSFGDRVGLALALGLDPVFQGPLTSINKLRNAFAHEEHKEEVTEADVQHLRSAMLPAHISLAEEMHELSCRMAKESGIDSSHLRPRNELRAGNRWAIYALSVLSGVEFSGWVVALT